MISLIQHFEADFLWKVSLKILNSGIILKKTMIIAADPAVHYYLPQRYILDSFDTVPLEMVQAPDLFMASDPDEHNEDLPPCPPDHFKLRIKKMATN